MKFLICILLLGSSFLCFGRQPKITEVPEPLYSIAFNGNVIRVGVRSQGCTRAEDFKLLWTEPAETAQGPIGLRVVRITPDRCRAKPRKLTLELSANLAVNRIIHVDNRFQSSIPMP